MRCARLRHVGEVQGEGSLVGAQDSAGGAVLAVSVDGEPRACHGALGVLPGLLRLGNHPGIEFPGRGEMCLRAGEHRGSATHAPILRQDLCLSAVADADGAFLDDA